MDARRLLTEAPTALGAGNTGAANEFLERAQTRILTRSTTATSGSEPLRGERAQQITQAREALQRRNAAEAMHYINFLLAGS